MVFKSSLNQGNSSSGVSSVNAQTGAVTIQSSSLTVTNPSSGVVDIESQPIAIGNGTTHAFASASTLTDAAAFAITLPNAGTNASITNAHGLLVQTAAVSSNITNSYGLNVTASTGATNNYAAQFNGNVNTNGVQLYTKGTAIASASTIAPVNGITHITGTATISTITPPAGTSSTIGCTLTLIADGAWSTTTGGNIFASMTATAGIPYVATYDGTTWYIK